MRTFIAFGISAIILVSLIIGAPVHAATPTSQKATGTIDTEEDLGVPTSTQQTIYNKIINTLKPTGITLPEYLTLAYYKQFLLDVNTKIDQATGVNILNIVSKVIHWFTVFINFLRDLLLKIKL